MLEAIEARISIDTDGEAIPIMDLSRFLYYFRGTYALCLEQLHRYPFPDDFRIEDARSLAELVAGASGKPEGLAFRSLASKSLPINQDLRLIDISRTNPLELLLLCVGVPLVAAVILSGGEINILKGSLKIKLPPLGTGIAEMRKALAEPGRATRIRSTPKPRLPRE